ncbi:MAG TPA: Spy/CpxP family protein refolding chaperone [Nitrospirota bacterium]|nr:Spy/CpxP family protein refolding chaperone [Nitrospirota bacterium]
MRKFKQLHFILVIGVVTTLIFSSAIGTVYAGGAFEGDEGDSNRVRWEQNISRMYKKLNLTPGQDKQLKDHRNRHRSQMETLYKEIKVKREQLGEELQKTEFDMSKVQQVHDELKSLKAGMEDNRLEGILEVRKILTPEQFSKFMKLKKERTSDKKHRRP